MINKEIKDFVITSITKKYILDIKQGILHNNYTFLTSLITGEGTGQLSKLTDKALSNEFIRLFHNLNLIDLEFIMTHSKYIEITESLSDFT
jgi:hypothetical protein